MKPKNMSVSQYLHVGVGRRLSKLGEMLGCDLLVYNPFVFYTFHEMALESAPHFAKSFKQLFPHVGRLVDVGAGTCAYAAELDRVGYQVQACEKSWVARRWGKRLGVDCKPFDLKVWPPTSLCGPFDIAYSIEVAEHLTEPLGQKLVEYLSSLAPTVVFTAAQPGQDGTGHICLRPKEYWIDQFHRCGMRYSAKLSDALALRFKVNGAKAIWLMNNCMVFSNSDHKHLDQN